MAFFSWLSDWSSSKSSWLVLFLTAIGLELSALFFQHVLGYAPCVMCIYQRNAVFGIAFAGLLVLIANNLLTRLLGYGLWALSAGWGLLIAMEHREIIVNPNPLFPCDVFPNFPSFMPLNEWIPPLFDATGFCNDDSWQFLGFGMAEWMHVVFSLYLLAFVVVFINRLSIARKP